MSDVKRLMSIGEVAKSIGMTRRMILNYEDKGLLRPDVKEGDTGNRYYTPDTLTRIRTIRVFQNMGLTLDEIRGYFDDSTDLALLIARLETMRDELNLNIEKLRARVHNDHESILHTTIPAQTVYRRTFRAPTVHERMEHLRDIIPEAMRLYGSDSSKRMFFIESPLDDPELVSYCVAVPEDSEGEFVAQLPETRAICVYHHGGYEELPDVRKRLVNFAREQGISITGACRHIYLEGPPQHKEPAKYITQVVLPIVDRRRSE